MVVGSNSNSGSERNLVNIIVCEIFMREETAFKCQKKYLQKQASNYLFKTSRDCIVYWSLGYYARRAGDDLNNDGAFYRKMDVFLFSVNTKVPLQSFDTMD